MLTRSVLRAWWHADDHGITALMTDDGSGLISSWKDRINLVNVTATTTGRPTWSATGLDGSRAGVVFDGVANAMTSTAITALPTGSVGGEIFAVANVTPFTGSSRHIIGYGAGSGLGRRLRPGNSTDELSKFAVDDTSANAYSRTANDGFGKRVFHGIWSGTTIDGTLDGVPIVPNTNAATLNTATTRLRVASNIGTSPGNFLPGSIRQILITTLLTDTQRRLVRSYLAEDAGIGLVS